MASGDLEGFVNQAVAQLERWLQASVTWVREIMEAQARAEALLRDSLSEAQYQYLRSHGHLEIASHCQPGRIYHIPANGSRVRVYEGGRFCGELCVGPVMHVPTPDVVLSHKLMIEGCEEDYLKTARWILPIVPTFAPLSFNCGDSERPRGDGEQPNTPPSP